MGGLFIGFLVEEQEIRNITFYGLERPNGYHSQEVKPWLDFTGKSAIFKNGLEDVNMDGIGFHYIDKGCWVIGYELEHKDFDLTAAALAESVQDRKGRVAAFMRRTGVEYIETMTATDGEHFLQESQAPLGLIFSYTA